MKNILHYNLIILILSVLVVAVVPFAQASNCSAGEDYIFDFYDSDNDLWIDTPDKYCIRGTFGNETCTADYECDPFLETDDPNNPSTWGMNNPYTANTYFCNAGIAMNLCDESCQYVEGDHLCDSTHCIADSRCNDVAPGAYIADPSGDGTRDQCTNPMCAYVDGNVCNASYGADVLCDGISQGTQDDFDGDSTLDLCNATCQLESGNVCNASYGADPLCDGVTQGTNQDLNGDATLDSCDDSCQFVPGDVCDGTSGADALCDGVQAGTQGDFDGDYTIDTCNSTCQFIPGNICESDYGADILCDGIEQGELIDLDSDSDLDVCNSNCEYKDCTGGNDSMCLEAQACLVDVCQMPLGTYNVPEFNSTGIFFVSIFTVLGLLSIYRKHRTQ